MSSFGCSPGMGSRTAESRAKLILLELGLQAGLDQRIEGIKIFVSQKLPCRPMELRMFRTW